MRPLRTVLWACALGLVGASPGPAQAAWCNVFQVCCNSCKNGGSVSAYGDAGCNPCPQPPVCTTRYVQRCYYQPVTCYQTRSYYEPVTTYRTSYYYEPVTTYRYSCYYDPCTCSYQQAACPQTCYRLRSQCCPVQSWVQRCCQVPVTSYQRSFYWEPVTSCCAPAAPCCPTSCATTSNDTPAEGYSQPATQPAPAYTQPAPAYTQPAPQPGVNEQRSAPVPGVQEYSDPGKAAPAAPSYDRQYPQNPPMPPAGSTQRQVPPRRPAAPVPVPAQRPPSVKLDRIVSMPATQLQGQVVRNDNVPQAGARLMFVGAQRQGPQQSITADARGQFRVTLASGGWLVYVQGADGRPVFHSKVDLRDNETRQMTLVSR